ncbi:MAG: adaptor protein MecA [Lachnospiraceae bacterium]|nr:adaptor protein MecA [Lachnospiraceae bacterium]
MKIEKINDHQIRCTLTKQDLASRNIKLSELAYGNNKARALFKDMMAQAAEELGFETDDLPLMVEAIPMTSDCIVLIVSKVEYPDELDTRFSQFTEDLDYSDDTFQPLENKPKTAANDIIEMYKKAEAAAKKSTDSTKNSSTYIDITKLFVFKKMEDIIRLSHVIDSSYEGTNLLYKNPSDNLYYLVVSKSQHTPEEFNKVCNIISEYGSQCDLAQNQRAYFVEHYRQIIGNNAIHVLANL